MLHKGSQKRIYVDGTQYFVTFNTKDRIKYFEESIFCEVFINSLRLSKLFYKYDLYAFVVLKDHVHLLFHPHEVRDLSKIIQYLKRHITRNINFIMKGETETKGAIGQSLLQFRVSPKYKKYSDEIRKANKLIIKLKKEFIVKYGKNQSVHPKFKWQKSFHDHYIRNEKDFDEHINYIYNNPIKHKLADAYEYNYIYTNYPELITD